MQLRKLLRYGYRSLTGEPHEKRDFSFYVMNQLAKWLDMRIYNKHTNWQDDRDFLAVMRRFDPRYPRVKERQFFLYNLARSLRHLTGETAECGALGGASSHVIMSAFEDDRAHHIFDSFSGLSEPTEHDKPKTTEVRALQAGEFASPLEATRRNLAEHPHAMFYKGWIPERFDEVADKQFCLVSVDVDFYEPTRDSVLFFFPRLVPGGALICDDYGFSTCPGAKKAMDEAAESLGRRVIHVPTGQGLILK
ncbi:TylF/MycF/NovP-related O-methyltransferase [Pelagibius sp.]|uniref:TylF/MycF/NovP-related O-methyltransferase n=1 Tax=Pelagibius sp. TaxID=1931238 RepID=UPI002637EE85|nr:TylF/MycF/NovP-related O-methyltransferase [Pelagibius sp.]